MEELDLLEADYEFAREYVKSAEFHRERERIRLRIEKLILSHNNNVDCNFVLGQCYSLVKELTRFDEVIRNYEAKKKSIEELSRLTPHHRNPRAEADLEDA